MSSLNDFVIENGVLKKYVGEGGDVVIPDGVTEIEGFAFFYCENLASITIPNGVIVIGSHAFDGCENLASITIPDSVKGIGDSAFWRCTSLTSITIPDGVTRIGERAFSYCRNLASITIPNGVTEIGELVFSFCTNLASIIIPDGVTEISKWAFNCCKNITSIVIKNVNVLPKELRIFAIIGFTRNCDNCDQETYDRYVKYIKTNAGKLVDIAMQYPELLTFMCEKKLITAKNIDLFLQKAIEGNCLEIKAMIMDYQNSSITQKQKETVEKRKERQENEIFDRMVARREKEGIDGP